MRRSILLKQLMKTALLLALVLVLAAPLSACSQAAEQKVVRVGWFDSPFCYWDEFGRRCGIDYEYQHRISAYTGWTYEYVEDSWPNLLQKLMDGEIDLLSDVSYKPERTEYMLFPDLPMGNETYYIYIDAGNREITADNLASINGKRIGVNQGSVQEGFLKEWAEKNGISVDIVPLTTGEDESTDMVTQGMLDGLASIYSYGTEQKIIPVCRIGGSDYYYAVSKNRPDLLAELNMALAGIRDEDPYFSERLNEDRMFNARTNAYLTPAQADWVAEHGAIRIGYLADYLPFCQADRKTGELTGALKDYLVHAENSMKDSGVRFEAVPYDTVSAALEAMKAGEVDCVFPVYLNYYDSDQMGIRLTSEVMKTGMNAAMRDSESATLSRDSNLAVALLAGSPNVETFIMEQYPVCRRLAYPDAKACCEAVASGTADCVFISNYRIPEAEELLKRYNLYSVPTREHIPFSFAVRQTDRELYFLLNKTVGMTSSGDMDSALASYMHVSRKVTFIQFLKDNWIAVIGVLTVLFAIIVFLLLQRLKGQRKAHEQQRLLEEAAEIAELKQTITSLLDNMPGMNSTKDAETGVYLACNQAFADYARKKSPEEVTGLTDAHLFDAETAKRLAEDDRMALSMDEPYIFFEDAAGPAGSRRQIKTTKLKYTDAAGRLCLLGFSQDITDSFRIRRGGATTKESYEKARGAGAIYTHIAQALAQGYTDLYYIDLNTEEYIQYHPDDENGLTEARRGWHFFEECQEEIDSFVYPDDRETMKKALDRKALVSALEQNNTFFTTCRLNGEQEPVYVSMKVTRMRDDDRFIVLGVMNIDSEVKQRNAAMRSQEEQIAYNRLSALAGNYFCIFVVAPETGRYREFSAMDSFESFARTREGEDFFTDAREQSRTVVYAEDQERFAAAMVRENILADIGRHGIFTLSYRLMVDGKPRYVRMKAVQVEEKEGRRLIVGINDIDAQVRQEEAYVAHMNQAKIEANVDALTGVKNRHAYLMAEERLNAQIAENPAAEFAVVILDVNDLKKINDRDGHKAGDLYLREACKIICNTFKHSPVFRIGGDEFAVIAQGDDYACVGELISRMNVLNEEALRTGGIVIACGMAKHEGETSVAPVFERADQQMYENKNNLKNR